MANPKAFSGRFSEEYEASGRYRYHFYRRLVKAVIRQIDKDRGRILDLGTGNGELALRIATGLPKSEVIAHDINPAAMREAKREAGRMGIGNIRFMVSPWEGLDKKLESVDIVASSAAFHHIKNKKAVIKRIHKVLPKNGKLIIGDWFKPSREYERDVEKIRARYPNSASEFDRSWKEFLQGTGREPGEQPEEYTVCPTELKEIMKKTGFRRQTIVKLPIADFAVVVGVK